MRRFMWAVAVGLLAPCALQAQTFTNVKIPDAQILAGGLFVAQIIQFQVPRGQTYTISEIIIKNTVSPVQAVQGHQIAYVEVRRGSETGAVLKNTGDLEGFVDGGATLRDLTNNTFTAGTHRIYIIVLLKATDDVVGKQLKLGATKVKIGATEYAVTYPPTAPAALFTVVPAPKLEFIGEDATVYRGQRFLAGQIMMDCSRVPIEVTISQIRIKNGAADTPLAGTYISALEIRRASDDALLGQASSTELAKLTTTGTTISVSSNNKVPAYSDVLLEIWVTLKADAPAGQNFRPSTWIRCNGTDFQVTGPPRFTVGAPEGFEDYSSENLGLTDPRIFSNQRFLAQRLRVLDRDDDPYVVTINSLVIQNVAPSERLSDTYIAAIEVVRGRDGALMGRVTNASGLNSGGVRVTATANNLVMDDNAEVLEIWITLKDNVPNERKLKLKTVVWHSEDTRTFYTTPEEGPEFTTGPASGEVKGFDAAAPDPSLRDRTVYQGARFLGQRLTLRDNDVNPYDVAITSLVIRNKISGVPLADQHVAKIEIRRKADGALLGEVSEPTGLSLAGVRIATPNNNVTPDDTSVEIEIWITLKGSAPKDRKLQLETVVWHVEGIASFQTDALTGPTFTTDIGQAPRNVGFGWTPEKPEAGQEVTFTPSADITDPGGNISQSTFGWDFGDGKTKETTGPAAVKHTYTRGGTFSVTLTVTNVGGLSASKTKEIEVIGKQPTVNFTFTPAEPTAGETITFTATITDPATPPLSPYTYRWDLGDGRTLTQQTSATQQTITHAYAAAGTFTVILEVTNSRGETGKAQKQVTVTPPVARPPTVTALTASTTTPEVGQSVTFTATATTAAANPITGWKWDFGDGTPVQETAETATTLSITRAFRTVGIYTVRVWAKNNVGWSEPRSIQVVAHPAGMEFGTVVLDNPAETQCRIQIFAPAGATDLKITILDQAGRPVIRDKSVSIGTFTWDLKDAAGRAVPNGLYLFFVTARIGNETRRTEIGRILVRR